MTRRAPSRTAPVAVAGLLALALAAPGGAATAAEPAPGDLPRALQQLDLQQLDLGAVEGADRSLSPALLDPTRSVTVMLVLEDEPVAAVRGAALEAGSDLSAERRTALRSALQRKQAALTDDVRDAGASVVSRLQVAYNGLKVRTPVSALPRLQALPGVVAIHPVPTYEPTNATSVPFLGIPQEVWEDRGHTGDGVSIGVIDTGIDYTHADFGGEGTTAAYEANDPLVVEEGTFPTAKVVGGFDFVGDAYDAGGSGTASIPNPDPDPLDCNGHGTHVAGTAAGSGVTAGGDPYDGPYTSEAYDDTEFAVGPGVAPRASLHALKVFGCDGSTSATIDAVEYAVARELDVVNLSLGSVFSGKDDPLVDALTNASRAGVVVVASAGNSGPSPYITGAPGVAPGAISVAAMESTATIDVADLVAGDTRVEQLQNSNGADLTGSVSGPLVVLEDDPATPDVDESLGCVATDYPDEAAGAVVVTFRGTCARVDRAVLGQERGAVAVIFVNSEPGAPPVEGVIPGVDIPFLGATPEQGAQIVPLEGQTVTVEDAGTVPNPAFRRAAGFTSRGPSLFDDGAKPDVAAPGVAINSAFVGSGAGGTRLSGTSMAAPHVAGVAALVREARPQASVRRLKSAIVGTADPDGLVDYETTLLGAGLVDPDEAIRTPVVALGDRDTASLSFGYVESPGRFVRRKLVRLANTSGEPVTFRTGVEESSDPAGGATVSVAPRTVRVPARSTRPVLVTMTVGVPDEVPDDFEPASGLVTFTPVRSEVPALRVPYLLVANSTSLLQAAPEQVSLPEGDGQVEVEVTNTSPVPGTADVYALGIVDGADDPAPGGAPDLRRVGVQSFPGVAPFPGEPGAVGVGAFAVHVADRLTAAVTNEYDVLLDTDEDGVANHAVIGLDFGAGATGAFDGVFASFTLDLGNTTATDDDRIVRVLGAGGAFNSSVVSLPFILSDVGLVEGNGGFTYTSAVFGLLGAGSDVASGEGAYDAVDQPVETGQLATLAGGGSATLPVGVDGDSLADTPASGLPGLLVVFQENPTGLPAADVVRFERAGG